MAGGETAAGGRARSGCAQGLESPLLARVSLLLRSPTAGYAPPFALCPPSPVMEVLHYVQGAGEYWSTTFAEGRTLADMTPVVCSFVSSGDPNFGDSPLVQAQN